MPTYRVRCLKEDRVSVDGVEIQVLKVIDSFEIRERFKIDVGEDEESVYRKLKKYIYGKECPILYLAYERSGERVESLISFVKGRRPYLLFPKLAKLLEVELLAREEGEVSEENVIFAKGLRVIASREFSGEELYVFSGNVSFEVSGASSNLTGIKLVTDAGERLLLLKKERSTQVVGNLYSKSTKGSKKSNKRRGKKVRTSASTSRAKKSSRKKSVKKRGRSKKRRKRKKKSSKK